MSDRAQDWTFAASNFSDGRLRPVRIGVNRHLKGGRIDFVALSDDEALALAAGLLDAVCRSRKAQAEVGGE